MIKHPFLSLFMVGILFLLSSPPAFTQLDSRILVGKVSEPDQVKIRNGDLVAFSKMNHIVDRNLFLQDLQLMKINSSSWYLIAFSANHDKAFAYPLKQKRKKLYLVPKTVLHTCTCNPTQSMESIFIIHEEKVIGCNGGNHSISARE